MSARRRSARRKRATVRRDRTGRILSMMRRLSVVLVLLLLAPAVAGAADPPAGITGLFLTTRYPALTVKAGETTTIDLSLRNFNRPPEQLALSVPQVAQGWKA